MRLHRQGRICEASIASSELKQSPDDRRERPIMDRFGGADALVNDPALTGSVGYCCRCAGRAGEGIEPEMPRTSRLHGAGFAADRWRSHRRRQADGIHAAGDSACPRYCIHR
jgi:hypothetical protein